MINTKYENGIRLSSVLHWTEKLMVKKIHKKIIFFCQWKYGFLANMNNPLIHQILWCKDCERIQNPLENERMHSNSYLVSNACILFWH